MDERDERALKELLDRKEIEECLLRYTRGVDRLDRELLLSAYHPDAIDDHGSFVGSPEAFADWALPYHAEHQRSTFHVMTNHSCELDGDTAHAETYLLYIGVNKNHTVDVIGSRYVDRLERRDGEWRIARRVCARDLTTSLPGDALATQPDHPRSHRDRTDASYQRPLDVDNH